MQYIAENHFDRNGLDRSQVREGSNLFLRGKLSRELREPGFDERNRV